MRATGTLPLLKFVCWKTTRSIVDNFASITICGLYPTIYHVDLRFFVFCLSLFPLPPSLALRLTTFFFSSPLASAFAADLTLTTVESRFRSSGLALARAFTCACASDQSVPSSMAYLLEVSEE